MTATDQQTKVVETTSYNTLFPLTGTVLEKKRTLNGVVLSDTINSYLTVPTSPVMGTPTFVYPSTSTVTGHEVDGTALPSTTTTNSNPDAYGNIQTVVVNVSDGSSKTTQNTYSNDATNWFLGRLTQTVVTSTVGSSTSRARPRSTTTPRTACSTRRSSSRLPRAVTATIPRACWRPTTRWMPSATAISRR